MTIILMFFLLFPVHKVDLCHLMIFSQKCGKSEGIKDKPDKVFTCTVSPITTHITVALLLSLCRTGNMNREITMLRAINIKVNHRNVDILQNVCLTLE